MDSQWWDNTAFGRDASHSHRCRNDAQNDIGRVCTRHITCDILIRCRMSPVELDIGVPYIASKIHDLDQCHPEDISSYLAEIRGYAHAAGYESPSPKPNMPPTPPYARSSSGSLATQAASTLPTPIMRGPSEPITAVLNPSLSPQGLPPQSLP